MIPWLTVKRYNRFLCSDSGDERNLSELEGELSGSFINDGTYTQLEDSDGQGKGGVSGLAFYRQLDRTPSQQEGGAMRPVKFRFRGGDRPLPITDKIMQRLLAPSPGTAGEVRKRESDFGDSDMYESDSFLVGESEEEEERGAHVLNGSTSSSLSQLLLDDSSFEL